jgi:hypothetical protein
MNVKAVDTVLKKSCLHETGLRDHHAQAVKPFKRVSWCRVLAPPRLKQEASLAPLRALPEGSLDRLVGDESQTSKLQGSCPSGQDNPEAGTRWRHIPLSSLGMPHPRSSDHLSQGQIVNFDKQDQRVTRPAVSPRSLSMRWVARHDNTVQTASNPEALEHSFACPIAAIPL